MVEFVLPANSKIRKGRHHAAPDGAARPRTFKVYRWNPDDEANPRVDTFGRVTALMALLICGVAAGLGFVLGPPLMTWAFGPQFAVSGQLLGPCLLIGGLIVRVGSRMIDNSIRSKLQRLQLAMKGVG